MSFRIGFTAEESAIDTIETAVDVARQTAVPRKSVVQVHFPKRNMTLAYYNDMFDLHCGDMVFVDGKLTESLSSGGNAYLLTNDGDKIIKTKL